MTQQPLNICLASSEFTPLAKTGGLADVCAALSAYLHRAGHDIRVLMPRYSTLNVDESAVHPVDFLQNLSMQVGPWNIDYSIDYTTLEDSGLTVYLLRCPALYERGGVYTNDNDEHLRFIFLSRAAIEMCQYMGFSPDVFHCHDWHTALVPLYLRTVYAWDGLFARTRSVLTIHNIGYQGLFGADVASDLNLGEYEHYLHQDDLSSGRINFLKTGLLFAHLLTTVSPTYAGEIQGEEYGMGLDDVLRSRSDRLVGILNGVDYNEWNPATDSRIPANFTPADLRGKAQCKQELMASMGLEVNLERPLVGVVTRLASQKGIKLMQSVLPSLLSRRDFAVVVLGSGERQYEQFFESLQHAARGRVAFYRGYNEDLAHTIEAGSDMFLMPSAYEPCGLNQMYSLKYGTIPIVRRTGGLADSVEPVNPHSGEGTGVVFDHYDDTGLAWALNYALDLYQNQALWRQVMHNGMVRDYSWEHQGEQYVALFRRLMEL